jgi:hypothetical protein
MGISFSETLPEAKSPVSTPDIGAKEQRMDLGKGPATV